MKFLLVLALCLTACGEEPETEKPRPTSEFTMCDASVLGICQVEYSTHMNIDYARLSTYLEMEQYEFNYWHPGLDLEQLANDANFVMVWEWADYHTVHKGEYSDPIAEARIYLRRGENITPQMECADRYLVAAHEALHFIIDRFLQYQYAPGQDSHDVPNMFNRWAFNNDASFNDTVEGRMTNWIMRDCYEEESAP